MTTLIAIATAWPLAATLTGLLLGAVIRHADTHDTPSGDTQ